ncbi:MAG: twin-arginine translocation signal domain-containing protein, partial [Longimicrobiales bacterium]
MNQSDCSHCEGCTTSRRDFLRGAAGAAAALSALFGVEPARATALSLRAVRGERVSPESLRYDVPPGDGAIIDRENEIIIMRQKGRAYAFALS